MIYCLTEISLGQFSECDWAAKRCLSISVQFQPAC